MSRVPEPFPAPPPATGEAAGHTLHVACLCADWCRLCDAYRTAFDSALAEARQTWPGLQAHWIDIEDEAELVGDYDVPTFPTLLVVENQRVRFAGALEPQPETLRRVLRAALAAPGDTEPAQPAEVLALAARLRQRRANA